MARSVQLLTLTLVLAVSLRNFVSANDPCMCTREMNPVCGSDDVTYGNPCEFNCAQKTRTELTIRHAGQCGSVKAAQLDPSDNCFCTKEIRPVCGSNDVTYSNMCEFNCAQRTRIDLTVRHKGQCAGEKSNLILD